MDKNFSIWNDYFMIYLTRVLTENDQNLSKEEKIEKAVSLADLTFKRIIVDKLKK